MPSKKRDYRAEYDNYQGTPEQKKNRAARNAARAEMVKEGKVKKGDGKEVDHKVPLDAGGSTKRSNLRVLSREENRAFERDSKGQPKKKQK